MIGCEEGWTYIAEWTGVPLSFILDRVGTQPGVRYVVYRSIQPDWWESIDMDDALHPQTLIAHRMNGETLPVPFGGPLRLRAAAAARLQEREVFEPADFDRQHKAVRQRPGIGGAGGWVLLVRGHLIPQCRGSGNPANSDLKAEARYLSLVVNGKGSATPKKRVPAQVPVSWPEAPETQ